MIDRKFILALGLSMLLLFAYNAYYDYRFGDYLTEQGEMALDAEKNSEIAKSATHPAQSESSDPAPSTATAVAGSTDSAPVEASSPLDNLPEVVSAENEKRIVIDNGVVQITLSNKGGVPIGYKLKKFYDVERNFVDLYFDYDKYIKELAKKDKDTGIKKIKRFPTLGLKFPRDAFSDKINGAYFSPSVDNETINVVNEPFTIGYTYKDGTGVLIQKSYTFKPGSYGFDFSVSVVTDPKWGQFDYSLVWFGLGNEDNHMVGISSYTGPILLKEGEKIADKPDDETTTIDYKGNITWGGLTNRYYTAIAMPETSEKQNLITRYLDDSNFAMEWVYPVTQVGAERKFAFYVGPKIRHFLNEYKNGMQGVIDYGWFDIISKPLYMIMRFFHGWFNNWGWAIIALTVVVKLAFFPLTQKSFRSMQKLQKVQPQIKKIQEAYKDDREKMNSAMMSLYKEHKVNPLGGCLPMILQIPIFFALYKVLLESIELKGADFFLWIHDLSLKDPYYVTPLLMGVSMFAQQWLTPSTGDPTQRKIMMALPLVFTFMFLSFPAGLVIYWLVSNILTIVQQWVIRRETA